MAIKPLNPSNWHSLRELLPPAAELHDYEVLCMQALVVIIGFLLLGLLLATVATVVPGMLP